MQDGIWKAAMTKGGREATGRLFPDTPFFGSQRNNMSKYLCSIQQCKHQERTEPA